MKNCPRYCFLLVMVLMACCAHTDEATDPEPGGERPPEGSNHQLVIEKLSGKPDGNVMIMAHRADWKHAPENSIEGIQNCIEQGLDIIEIDIKKTKDGKLVLMHDNTLDRTTNGSGNVSDHTWAELKALRLLGPDGFITDHSIPLLEEAMLAAKGRIFVFIDKSYEYLNDVHQVLAQTGTLKQTAVDGIASFSQYQTDYPEVWRELNLAPRIGTGQSQAYIDSHVANTGNIFLFPSCNLALSQSEAFQTVTNSERWLMFSTLTNTSCSEDFESTWTWAIHQGMDIIITDKPVELLDFLRKEGKHV